MVGDLGGLRGICVRVLDFQIDLACAGVLCGVGVRR